MTAIANLKKLCEKHLAGRYQIETIDLVENPTLAHDDDILAKDRGIANHPLLEMSAFLEPCLRERNFFRRMSR